MIGLYGLLGRGTGLVPSAVEEAPSPAHAPSPPHDPAQLDTQPSTTVVPQTVCCCQRQGNAPSIRNSQGFPAYPSMGHHLPVIPPHPSSHQFESTDSSEDQCPISLFTLKEMRDSIIMFPVLASDGHPYAYHALSDYVHDKIQKNNPIISPITQLRLTGVRIHPSVSPLPRYLVERQEDMRQKVEQLNHIIQYRTTDPIDNQERQEARRYDPRTTVVPFNTYTF